MLWACLRIPVYWSSSFIHGSDDHDYMIISHAMIGMPFTEIAPSMYRASILDITDPTIYTRFEIFSDVDSTYLDDGTLNATFPDYGSGTLNACQAIHTWSSVSGSEFDLTFEFTSPALLNGDLGTLHLQQPDGPRMGRHSWQGDRLVF